MKTKTAGEIMIPLDKYPHIPYWFTIRQCVAEIHHAELEVGGRKSLARAVLVFDEKYRLLGMVRRRDILRGLEPESIISGSRAKHPKKLFEAPPDPELLEISYETLLKEVPEKADQPVSVIMAPIENKLEADDHILKIIYEMSESRQSMLPVMKDNIVVGVVRTVEIMNEISKILEVD